VQSNSRHDIKTKLTKICIKETYVKEKKSTKETKRDLQLSTTKETYKRDLKIHI